MSVTQTIRRKIHRLQQPDVVSQIIRGAGSAFIVNGVGQALLGVMQVVLARVMGKSEYGIYSYVNTTIVFLAVCAGLGMPLSTVRFLPEYAAKNDWARYNGVVKRFSLLTLSAGIVLAILGSAFLFSEHAIRGHVNYYVPFLVGIWMIPLLSQSTLISQMSRATRRVFLAYGPTKIIQPLIVTAVACFIWHAHAKVEAVQVLLIFAASMVGTIALQNIVFRRDLAKTSGSIEPVYDTKTWLTVSWPMMLMNICQNIFLQVGVFVIGSMMHARDVATFRVASQTVLTVNFVLQATNVALGPEAAALFSTGRLTALQRAVSATVKMSFYSAALATAVLLIFGHWILKIYGHGYTDAYVPMVALALGALVATGAGPVLLLMNMTGFERMALKVCTVAAVADIVANVIGVHFYGYTGAAIATASVQAMWNIWLCLLVKRHIGINSFIINIGKGMATDGA